MTEVIKLAEARKLCTAAEFELVKASTRGEIGKLSQTQLKQKVRRSRTLRGKWRDTATGQRRAVQQQQGARTTGKAARSARKAELFQQVLTRFEAQLEKQSKPGSETRSGGAKSKPPKSVRSRQHREQRAGVRKTLTDQRDALEQTAKPSAPNRSQPPAASKPAAAAAVPDAAATPSVPTQEQPTAAPVRKQPGKKAGKKRRSSLPPAQDGGLQTTRAKQLKAGAAAKRQRIKSSGLATRIRGHVSARGKRKQARRDRG